MGIRGERPSNGEPPPLIELVVVDRGTPRAADHVPATSAHARPPRRRRDLALLALGAFVVIAIAAALQRGAGDDAVNQPATTVPPTTSAPPATTIASVVTSSTSTGATAELDRWSILSLSPAEMSVLDLGTRELEQFSRPPAQRSLFDESPILVGDRVVYTSRAPSPAVWTQGIRDASATRLLDRASVVAKSSNPGLFWVLVHDESTQEEHRVVEIDVEGRRATTVTVPAGMAVAGAHATGLWLTGSGRIFSMTRAGTVQQVAVGTLIDASISGAIFDDCAIAGPCSLQLSRTPVSRSRIGPTADLSLAKASLDSDSLLSPDGRWLMLSNGVLELRTGGQLPHQFRVHAWRWSPDSQWVFLSDADGTMAWNLGDQRLIRIDEFGTRLMAGVVGR